jgi:hypothetical protein
MRLLDIPAPAGNSCPSFDRWPRGASYYRITAGVHGTPIIWLALTASFKNCDAVFARNAEFLGYNRYPGKTGNELKRLS